MVDARLSLDRGGVGGACSAFPTVLFWLVEFQIEARTDPAFLRAVSVATSAVIGWESFGGSRAQNSALMQQGHGGSDSGTLSHSIPDGRYTTSESH